MQISFTDSDLRFLSTSSMIRGQVAAPHGFPGSGPPDRLLHHRETAAKIAPLFALSMRPVSGGQPHIVWCGGHLRFHLHVHAGQMPRLVFGPREHKAEDRKRSNDAEQYENVGEWHGQFLSMLSREFSAP
jgi:hypothetical protein